MDPRPESKPRANVGFDLERGSLAWNPRAPAPAVEDVLVNAAFRELVTDGIVTSRGARDLGRAMGRAAGRDQLAATLEAFSHLGVGCLRLSVEEPGRFEFQSPDLLGSDKSGNHTCAMALGFLEGLAKAVTGRDSLGAETRCRSRGHASCAFVVMTKLQKPPARRAERP